MAGEGPSPAGSKNGDFKDLGEGTWLSSNEEENGVKIAWIIWVISPHAFMGNAGS